MNSNKLRISVLLTALALTPFAVAQDKAKPAAAPAAKPAPAAAPAADHKMFAAKDLEWKDSPSLPGAKIAVLEGPMNEAVPFTARIKVPAGWKVMPHTHPGIEHVTVISGSAQMGKGDKWDDKAMHTLNAGDMSIMQPNTAHFAGSKEGGVIQIHGVGPWKVVYVNPADDPMNKAAAAPAKKDDKKK